MAPAGDAPMRVMLAPGDSASARIADDWVGAFATTQKIARHTPVSVLLVPPA